MLSVQLLMKMKKNTSIVTLVIMAVVTVLLFWTVISGWGPLHTGAMKNIKTGLDLSGGVSITYEAEDENPREIPRRRSFGSNGKAERECKVNRSG